MKDTNYFSIEEALRDGWKKTKEHFSFLFLILVITFAVGSVLSIVSKGDPSDPFVMVWNIVSFVVQIIISIGFIKIFLYIFDGKEAVVKDLFRHYKLFWKYLFVSLLYGFIVLLGLIVLILPGIYLAIRYSLASVLIIDRDISVMQAFSESARLTHNTRWKILGLMIVLALVNLLGLLLLGIGLFVTIPITTLAFIFVYRSLLRAKGTEMMA